MQAKEKRPSRAGRVSGKSTLITGAAKGIGRATALLFAAEGARLVAADVDSDSLKELPQLVPDAEVE